MKIRIPRKIKFRLEKKYITLSMAIIILTVVFLGSAAMIKNYKERKQLRDKQEECASFTEYLNNEVLPLTQNSNVTDCSCVYSPQKISEEITGNCLCSCKLYDENGTLIDDDWNPLFSTV